ncbi:flagellar biosynthesis protein FlgJ [Epibacterium sp. SM1969]|uniref:Flagellar biosynthesis protein FlgJ n=2 Tax=Tritonibacter aquimaris TaxID=2663379 RepID=A0A844AS46_9RHOB|nr:flagellar biosynthesis protein FlgJ [Tritonibacter aquimaris]
MESPTTINTLTANPIQAKITPKVDPMRQAAMDLESAFLSEMLKAAGLGKTSESFGGGAGEDQFSSFLVEAQAKQMTKAGGIGLAESLYNALKESQS